jgi:glucan phosphoethanolaminetransferase (alkaline phosphatase superfamily)
MTITGWVLFIISAVIIAGIGIIISICADKPGITALGIIITFALIIGLFCGMKWYFNNTASGTRALVDQKSELNNGIERVVNVYTANGDLIAQYEGKIDIDTNDGGYVKFDFEGKRYIYYNCFIETIADISGV